MSPRLDKYIRHGVAGVEGWLSQLAIALIVNIAEAQRVRGICGPVCEIGVHHGKLLLLLHLLSNPEELCVGWDLFQRQSENVDQSGRGDQQKLLDNFRRHGGDLHRLRAITANSLELTSSAITRDCAGRPRLFSIDGGHSVQTTLNDLKLAADALCQGGIVILDDFFNEAWPGVAEGTCLFFSQEPLRLHPVAIAGNKLVFTNTPSDHSYYVNWLSNCGFAPPPKRSEIFGREVLIWDQSLDISLSMRLRRAYWRGRATVRDQLRHWKAKLR